MHNALAVAHNAIVFISSKLKDNVLNIVTVPVILPQPAALSNPMAILPHALCKALNAPVIKRCIYYPES